MDFTSTEVLQFIEENDVKFVRLMFCDIFGNVKNISILSSELSRAFEHGISFDASAIHGFMNVDESDLVLFPNPATLSVLPWRPQQGRVVRFFCDIRRPDGTPFEGDGRHLLRNAERKVKEAGYSCKIGAECEFYLFETDENGYETLIPHDKGSYFDVAPLDRGENVRRDICLTLEEMGIQPESSHHEQGPGQNEIDFKYSDPLNTADNLITFKTVVKTIASINGLFASFLPKPIPHAGGNGLHINMSLFRNGSNIFHTGDGEHSAAAESFIAGILNRAREISAFLLPIPNSYARLGSFEAPKYVSWSHQNRSQLIRIPAGSGEFSRMELRAPDPSCNPYFVFTLLMLAGLEGIQNNTPLPPSYNIDLYHAEAEQLKTLPQLPENLEEAIVLAQDSLFLKSAFPSKIADIYLAHKVKEWEKYTASQDKRLFDRERYFPYI